MQIYARTELGNLIAYDSQSDLPLQMRSLLKLVDGRTTDQTYVASLSAFGDVAAMFAHLLEHGYIQPVVRQSRSSTEGDGSASKFSDSKRETALSRLNPSRWFSASKSGLEVKDAWDPTDVVQRSSFNVTAASSFDATVDLRTHMDHRADWVSGNQPVMRAQFADQMSTSEDLTKVKQVTDLMATFVLEQMPERAFGMLSELEGIETWPELRAMLDGYCAIVSPLGQPAAEHLQYVRQNLVYNSHESV